MRPGDHYITNDPWLGTGHLHDLTVVTPAFRNSEIVGLFANTAHVIDIGGLGMGPEGRSVFEEGMYIPDRQVLRPGPAERDVLRHHPRRLAAAGRTGGRHLFAVRLQRRRRCRRLVADDGRVRDGRPRLRWPSFIFESCRNATLAEIAKLPRGTYRAEIGSDGYEKPVTLKAAMTILR